MSVTHLFKCLDMICLVIESLCRHGDGVSDVDKRVNQILTTTSPYLDGYGPNRFTISRRLSASLRT